MSRVQAVGDVESRLAGVPSYYQSDLEDRLTEGFAEGQAERDRAIELSGESSSLPRRRWSHLPHLRSGDLDGGCILHQVVDDDTAEALPAATVIPSSW